ncbi:histone deacetylase [Egibacter rhizosphaerae]|uniref:Histone deacetylase n=1 Tax=Egibacter rhizosphaerae TaxID=1670831 RepID=A0A411YCD8_9ACTN|nr:histone deacetylase [Egibacter rhizosphaerae]QBI18913.1 histone deacetylase [Egibacter rhizosphaerae]
MSTAARIWYLGYGSNLDPARLRRYLAGGRAPGATRATPGARDPSPPEAIRAATLPHPLRFGGDFATWGGAAAFVDPARIGAAHATAYLLTTEQAEDVLRQENGRPDLTVDLVAAAKRGGTTLDPELPYGQVLAGDWLDVGEPAVTFTCADTSRWPDAPPPAAYLERLCAGLRTVAGLSTDEIAAYLLGADGVALHWSRERLVHLAARAG